MDGYCSQKSNVIICCCLYKKNRVFPTKRHNVKADKRAELTDRLYVLVAGKAKEVSAYSYLNTVGMKNVPPNVCAVF